MLQWPLPVRQRACCIIVDDMTNTKMIFVAAYIIEREKVMLVLDCKEEILRLLTKGFVVAMIWLSAYTQMMSHSLHSVIEDNASSQKGILLTRSIIIRCCVIVAVVVVVVNCKLLYVRTIR